MQPKLGQYNFFEQEDEENSERRSLSPILRIAFVVATIALLTAGILLTIYGFKNEVLLKELEQETDALNTELRKLHVSCDMDENVVKTCLKNYYAAFGMDKKKDLPAYAHYFKGLRDNFEDLQELALDFICFAEEELEECIGSKIEDQINNCISVEAFQQYFSLSKHDSNEYVVDLLVRNYECKNIDVLKENFKCIYPAAANRKKDFDTCAAVMKKGLEADTCLSMDDYLSCARDIFVEECGEQVSDFMCNVLRTHMEFDYPKCGPWFKANCDF